jgi:hypothetical protein
MVRLNYYQRLLNAYILRRNSHLSFWHEEPEINAHAKPGQVDEYWMTFSQKARYGGPFDDEGIPLLDYHGTIGRQYNPIAIAQYALGHFNLYRRHGDEPHRQTFLRVADWLTARLEMNPHGFPVWNHHFDWEYWKVLKSPWYSGLAQGQGISVLLRAHHLTKKEPYLDAAHRAFEVFRHDLPEGGVRYIDPDGLWWLEEYVTNPPTHILNGFIWALWAIYEYWLVSNDAYAGELFSRGVATLEARLSDYDAEYWSLYDLAPKRMKTLASFFYHRLHIMQLKVMHAITKADLFIKTAGRWEAYEQSRISRYRALAHKGIFKLIYY